MLATIITIKYPGFSFRSVVVRGDRHIGGLMLDVVAEVGGEFCRFLHLWPQIVYCFFSAVGY